MGFWRLAWFDFVRRTGTMRLMILPDGRRWLVLMAALVLGAVGFSPARAEVNKVETVAPDVFFHEGDIGRSGHCNNGWIVFEDYVLVVDANFPSGAQVILPKIREITPKPIRFAFDTHHHGDHAYANQFWVEQGATPVGHLGVLEEMRKYETGHFGGAPGRWEDTAKNRKDVAASRLKPPTLLFSKDMIFDDGKRRVELLHLGVAHTHGDGFAWLPKERILFTGDACVNGPYNYTGDGQILAWIDTLAEAIKLKPLKVCPGHGPVGGPEVLENQRQFFLRLKEEVAGLRSAGKSAADAKAAIESIKQRIRAVEPIAIYVGGMFDAQVEKMWVELGGSPFPKAAALGVPPRRTGEVRAGLQPQDVVVKLR